MVFALSILATLVGWYFVTQTQQRNAESEFRLVAERTTLAIRRRLDSYEQVLRGGGALYAASASVSRAQWKTYVEHVEPGTAYPGIQGVGYAAVITPQMKARHIKSVRQQGLPAYDIHPPGERELYTPIVYLEPFSGANMRASGFDMFAEPIRRSAMERARDEGATAVSGKVRLVQDTAEAASAGFLMFLPVYRDGRLPATISERRVALEGYVYAPFRMSDLMAGVIDKTMDDIDLKIFDGPAATAETQLFDRQLASADAPGSRQVSLSSALEFNGRLWTLHFESLPNFLAKRDDQRSTILWVGGGLISLLMFGLALVQASTRDRALALAEQMLASSRENEQRFAGIFHSAMDAIISIDEAQNIVLFSPAAEQMFRCKSADAVGTPLNRFLPERYRRVHHQHVARFGVVGASDRQMGGQRDLFGLRADGDEFSLEASISQVVQAGKKLFTVILRDITARKRAETALRNSEQRFRGLIEASPEAIYIHQEEKIIFVNQAAVSLFGASDPGQLHGRSIYTLFHADSVGCVRQAMEAILNGTFTTPVVERKIVRVDGSIRFVEIALSAFDNASGHAVQGLLRDVTERHEARAELERSHGELRQLSAALENAQEEERKRIARELHDDLGQVLTVLKMDVSTIKAKLKSGDSGGALLADIERMDGLLNHTVQSVRRISADLRPQLLDDLGLATVLEALMKQISQSGKIRCHFELDAHGLQIDEALATPLYRIAQEALNNVVKHADASDVTLKLFRDSDACVILEVVDNGKGIAATDRRKPASFGLIGMRERVYALGGELMIDTHPAGGTTIRVSIPGNGNRAREKNQLGENRRG